MSRIELIAETSTNHGGNLALAKEFIWRFAEAGADFVKFQHTRVKHLRPDDPQYEWFTRSEFSLEQFAELKAECEKAGTKFLTTVYNHQDVPEIVQLGLQTIKIGSGEARDQALASAINNISPLRCVLVSDGLDRTRPMVWWSRGIFLRCVSRYPHPASVASESYAVARGYSDHSVGIEGCQIAICCGASIIEKHVRLDHQARPCKPWEATVEEFKALRAFADDDPSRFLGRWQHA